LALDRSLNDWKTCAATTTSIGAPSFASRAAPTFWSALFSLNRSIRACAAGVIFFNNAGYLGMCGHGIIGVALQRWLIVAHIEPGEHLIETPVGAVKVNLKSDNQVSCRNIPAYRSSTPESRCKCQGMARSPAMWRGVATGFSWFDEHSFRPPRTDLKASQVDQLHTRSPWRFAGR
jgi:hypothetical protein